MVNFEHLRALYRRYRPLMNPEVLDIFSGLRWTNNLRRDLFNTLAPIYLMSTFYAAIGTARSKINITNILKH